MNNINFSKNIKPQALKTPLIGQIAKGELKMKTKGPLREAKAFVGRSLRQIKDKIDLNRGKVSYFGRTGQTKKELLGYSTTSKLLYKKIEQKDPVVAKEMLLLGYFKEKKWNVDKVNILMKKATETSIRNEIKSIDNLKTFHEKKEDILSNFKKEGFTGMDLGSLESALSHQEKTILLRDMASAVDKIKNPYELKKLIPKNKEDKRALIDKLGKEYYKNLLKIIENKKKDLIAKITSEKKDQIEASNKNQKIDSKNNQKVDTFLEKINKATSKDELDGILEDIEDADIIMGANKLHKAYEKRLEELS